MAKDYVALLTSQHRAKPKFAALVSLLTSSFGNSYDSALTMNALFDVDSAVGVQLDVVGEWVGHSREIPVALAVAFFGFADDPSAYSYGEEGYPQYGGRFYEEGDPVNWSVSYTGSSILSDSEYRTLLKALIIRNTSKGLTSDIVNAAQFIFNAKACLYNYGDMSYGVFIERQLTITEQAMLRVLDILPRPAGVKIRWFGYVPAAGYLGWDYQIGAVPFAEEGSGSTLGFLMEEF